MKRIGFLVAMLAVLSFNLVPDSYRSYLPKSSNTQIIEHEYYTVSFNDSFNQADWVAYQISTQTAFGSTKRSNNFKEDPKIENGNLKSSYSKSGYDRGHLCPAGSMAFTNTAMSQSFYMSNMSPQLPGFNRGVWKSLETQVRIWGYKYDTIYVVTGPVLSEFIDTIGEIPVPKYFYKIVLDYRQPELKAIGFVLENTSSNDLISNFAVTIDSVENLTGIDFFSTLPDSIENQLESKINKELWLWDSRTPKKQVKESNQKYRCIALTGSGSQCSRVVADSNSYCWQHQPKAEPTVWICGKSKVYHTARDHRGLRRCKKEIHEMKLSEAIKKGKRKCRDH